MTHENRTYPDQQASCDGKKRFTSWGEAHRVSVGHQHHIQDSVKLAPYHCRRCNGFHIGEKMASKGKRQMRGGGR